MKRFFLFLMAAWLLFSLVACKEIPVEACLEHKGEGHCRKCGLVYFDALAEFIMEKSNGKDGSVWAIVKEKDLGSFHLSYNEEEPLITLSYLSSDLGSAAVFLLKLTPSLDGYDWALGDDSHMIYGHLEKEEVSRKTLILPFADCTFPTSEYANVQTVSVSSLVISMESLLELLKDNEWHITVENLGFTAYEA